ncbi:ATP-dependent helicase hrpA [Klebsiella pneumoniae]|uniref:ATP-dependent helicase hrpA n=1 Tax=Klebsiella pneumoniae TaxID=573 RepID=A0A2X3EZK1_KLEPN|nr:ATP-dependent helicase hrpA [Klebsiella pneumoniae]
MREWQDIYTQLRQVVKELGLPINSEPAEYREIHTALLTGLLSHIGMKDADKQEFTGARNARFSIFPGSGLFKKPPKWTMVAELVETSRLWGRIAARIEPEWVEPVAQHLIKRSYSEPHWERSQGAVMATEKVTVYGLPIVAARKVNYSQIDPGAVPRTVYPPCAGGGRLADASRLLPRKPEAAGGNRRAGA